MAFFSRGDLNRLTIIILLLLIKLLFASTIVEAQPWGGAGAWGGIISFLKYCRTSIIPSATDTYSLGSSTKLWKAIYGLSIYLLGTEYLTWDTTRTDFVLSDDLIIEDIHPGIYTLSTDSDIGWGWHYHVNATYPYALWRVTDDGTGALVNPDMPPIWVEDDTTPRVYFPYGVGALDLGSNDLTTSSRIITTGTGGTGRFLTGDAGRTVFAFSGGDFDIRAGDGTKSSQNVMRVDNSGDFDFYDGNLTTTGIYYIGSEYWKWDSTLTDFVFSDDIIAKDPNPSMYIWNTENDIAFGWHYHMGAAYPIAFWRLDNGDVSPDVPLQYFVETTYDVYFYGDVYAAGVKLATGGATAWDDIGNPDNDGLTTIDFDHASENTIFTTIYDAAGSFFTMQDSDADIANQMYFINLDYSIDDGQALADYLILQDAGGTLLTIEEQGKIVMTPGGAGSMDIINITPSAVISTNETIWNGIKIVGAALDPSGDDVLVCGVVVDLSGVVPSGSGEDTDGIQVKMTDGEEHAIHIEEGKIVIDNTAGSAAGAEYTVVDIRLETSSLNANSDIHAIDVAVEAGTPSGTVVALGTHSNVTPIRQSIGSFSTPDQDEFAGKYVTNDWIDGDDGGVPEDLDGNEIFESNADWIAVGSAAVFSEIEVTMATPGTKTVFPTFWYSTEADPDNWAQFFPADDTDGFQQSGTIRWLLADISGSWTGDGAPGGAEATAGYWIKIVRTANANPGSPTPTTVKTGTITNYFWDKIGAIDVLSMEADTITEGGQAVWNATETDIIDSTHYVAGSIDFEHLAVDVIASAVDTTLADGDFLLFWDTSDSGTLKKVDGAEVRGGGAGGATYREYTFLPHTAGFDASTPAIVDWVTSSGTGGVKFPRAQFKDGEDDIQHYSFEMPSDATASADWILDIDWYSDEDVAEDVVWAIQISATSPDDADNLEEQAVDDADTVTDSADASEAKAKIQATLTIDYANCDGAVAGDEINFIFYRDGNDGSDTHTNECYLTRLHLKIPRS